ncbi:hypothetical protein F5X96DRAFT_383593 [Biscogniauxia mediterranea]|nr:hypothetical protein F5X96DRAFT_383593 [Biscogniauxia mediterranea]
MAVAEDEPSSQDSTLELLYRQLKELNRKPVSIRGACSQARVRAAYDDSGAHAERVDDLHLREAAIREAIKRYSRPRIRSLHLLDLPDEILMLIFEQVKGWWMNESSFDPYSTNQRDIMNVRLVCRRFCYSSSHLLIHFLTVSMDPPSLSRLAEVARHPAIRKGVRGVRVLLDFYDPALADDFWRFVGVRKDDLRKSINDMQARLRHVRTSHAGWSASRRNEFFDQMRAELQAKRALLKSFDGFGEDMAAAQPTDEQSLHYRKIFESAHREYRRRLEEQQRIQKSGTFVQDVASAIAMLPAVRVLQLCDRRQRLAPGADTESLYSVMIGPMEWAQATRHRLGTPPVDLMVKVISALGKKKVSLTTIDIEVSPPADYSVLSVSDDDCRNLSAAARKLRHFSFGPPPFSRTNQQPRKPEEGRQLVRFTNALLNTDTLRTVNVDFSCLRVKDMPSPFNTGAIDTSRASQNLNLMCFSNMSIHLQDLEQYGPSEELIWLNGLHLLSGTWAEALDILREKYNKLNGVGCHEMMLLDPTGAECNSLPEDKYIEIFSKVLPQGGSRAENFIWGFIGANPLRDWGGVGINGWLI